MIYEVIIKLEVDTRDYQRVKTPADVKILALAMVNLEADFPSPVEIEVKPKS